MKPTCPALRLLIALLTAAVFSPLSSAAPKLSPSSVEQRVDWTYYIASGNQLDRQIANIHNGDAQEEFLSCVASPV